MSVNPEKISPEKMAILKKSYKMLASKYLLFFSPEDCRCLMENLQYSIDEMAGANFDPEVKLARDTDKRILKELKRQIKLNSKEEWRDEVLNDK